MNKAKQIRAYKEANPTHKPSDIAKACGATTTYVYQVLHSAKKKKPVASTEAPTEGQQTLRKEITRLNIDIDGWKELYFGNLNELEQLQQDVIGYRAVISYLQGQLDGLTV
jgi:hypothetical protein